MPQEYGNQTKRIIFYDTDHRHAKLKIKLKHDSLTQAEFFRTLMTGYLENNINILNYLDKHKLNNQRSDSSRFVTLYEVQTKY